MISFIQFAVARGAIATWTSFVALFVTGTFLMISSVILVFVYAVPPSQIERLDTMKDKIGKVVGHVKYVGYDKDGKVNYKHEHNIEKGEHKTVCDLYYDLIADRIARF